MNRLIRFIKDSDYRFKVLSYTKLYNHMDDEEFIKKKFKAMMGRELNLNNPLTYNEKLQWLKLHDRNPSYTTFVDKVKVREYVERKIGKEYLIPLVGVWDKPEDIAFELLPNRFVLKCNHNSGIGICVCRNKDEIHKKKVLRQLRKGYYEDYYLTSREWPYKNVQRKIICEEYIGKTNKAPEDYKFFVFDGQIDSIMVCKGREKGYPRFYFYDLSWERLRYQNIEPEDNIEKPQNLESMIKIVEKLSFGFSTIRIDLYNIDGIIYFGEMTLYNQSGYDVDISYETDLMWGKKLNLLKDNKNVT